MAVNSKDTGTKLTGSQKSGSPSGISGKSNGSSIKDAAKKISSKSWDSMTGAEKKAAYNQARDTGKSTGSTTQSSSQSSGRKTLTGKPMRIVSPSDTKSGSRSLTKGGLQLGAGLTGAAEAKAQAAVEDVRATEPQGSGLQLGQWDQNSLANRNLTGYNRTASSAAEDDLDWDASFAERNRMTPEQQQRINEAQRKVTDLTLQDKTYWSDWDWINYEQAKQELRDAGNPQKGITNWNGRDSLIQELQDLDRNSVWITDPQEASRTEARRREIVNTLETNDALAGNGVQSYSDVHRARQIAGTAQGAAEQGSGSVVQSVTTLLDQLLGGPAEEIKNLIGITIDDLTGGRTNIQGMKNPITALNDWVHRTNQAEQEYYASRAGEDRTLGAINKYGTMTAAALPMSVVAIMSGGASLGPEALAATAAINESAGLSQVALMASNAVRTLAASPNTQIAFVQALGSGYDDAKADGATDEEATVYSIINAAYNALIEVGGGDEALGGLQRLPKAVREALEAGEKMPVIQYAKSIISEIGEENMQGIMERGLKTIYQDTPIGIDPYLRRAENGSLQLGAVNNLQNENAIISLPQMKEEALGAAIVSALLGGGQLAAEKAIDAAYRQGMSNEQIRQLVMEEMARRAAEEGADIAAQEEAAEQAAEAVQEQAEEAPVTEQEEEEPADPELQAEEQETPEDVQDTDENGLGTNAGTGLQPGEQWEGAQDETVQQDTAQEEPGLLGQEETGEGTGEAPAGGEQPDAGSAAEAAGVETAVGAGQTAADGSAGRYPGGRAGGEGGRLAPDAGTGSSLTGTAGSGEQGIGYGVRNALRQAGVAPTSSRALGLINGTDNQALRIVPQEMLQSISATRKAEATATDNLQALAYGINMTTGCSVDFVAGPIEVTGRDGQTRYVNGFFDPETRRIVVRVDSGRYTPQQIAKHEEFHALARLYPKLVKNVRDNVLQRYGRPELRYIIRTYQEKRRGINDIRSGSTDLFTQEAEELLEEIFADANGRMNAFDAGAEKYWADTRRGIADQQDRAFRERQRANATDRRRGPPETRSGIAASAEEQGPKFSAEEPAYTTYMRTITAEDVRALRSINGGKETSVNDFTPEDLQKTQKWANRYYRQTGAKSPFFRAWFGEWRAHDTTPVRIAEIEDVPPELERLTDLLHSVRGTYENTDTKRSENEPGWQIRVSGNGARGTRSHSGEGSLSLKGLMGIQQMIENGVLLDSEIHAHHKNNSPTPEQDMVAFDHKFYSLGKNSAGEVALYKITVEDIYGGKKKESDMRFHHLRYIEKVAEIKKAAAPPGSLTDGDQGHRADSANSEGTATVSSAASLPRRLTDGNQARRAESPSLGDSATEYTVADLYELVKQYDQEFNVPQREAHPDMLDEDGKPRVFYHGTEEDFTVFDRNRGRSTMDIQGMFFSPWEIEAEGYGSKVGAYYLALQNPAPESMGYRALNRFKGQNHAGIKAREYLESLGYDGVVNYDEVIAFYPEQIKSATDNIGTFDRTNPDIRFSVDEDENVSLADENAPAYNETTADPNLRQAIELVRSGAQPSEVYNATGYVKMANGNIIDPETGEIIWRNDNGGIRSTKESDSRSEKDGASETGASENDRRGTAGLDREQAENRREWSTLTRDEQRTITRVVDRHLKENTNSELRTLQDSYSEQESLAADIYSRIIQGRALYENDDLIQLIPNAGSLYEQIEKETKRDGGAAPKGKQTKSPIKFSLSEEDDGNEWYQLSLDDISDGDLTKSEMHPEFREKLENADDLTRRVQDVFRNMDPESELWMSPDEIEDAMDFNAWQSNLTLGDMNESDVVLRRLSDLAAIQDGDARTDTYQLMEDILPHLDATYRERWTGMDERREPIDRDFAEWYNDKHPSLYYPGYNPGDMFKNPANVEREIGYLSDLMESGRLDEDDDSEAWILHDGLEYSLNYYNEFGHFPRHEIYYSVDEDTNLFGEAFDEEEYGQRETEEEQETTSLPGARYGSSDVTFNDTEEVPFRWAVVPLDSLTVSNDIYGNINKAYPQELQPRDRTRLDSLNQTQKIANNLIPQKLEADSSIQNGAPVIRSDGVVVSGNGRSLAMMMAYDRGKAAGYVEYLKKNAAKWGLDPADIPEDKPVLVRVADDGQDWTQLARDANVSTIAGRSASEQARTDARNLERHPEVLDKLITDEDGNLNIPANRDFISDFIRSVIPENERNEMHTADGLLTQDGLARVQRAIFEAAYGDAGLLERLSERLDNDMKNVTNALLAAAPNVVAYENEVTDGNRYDVRLRDRILEAVRIYTDAKQTGQTVAQRTANLGFEEMPNEWSIYIARFIEQEKASGKQLRTMFNAINDNADELGDPNQIGFFGDEEEEKDFGQVMEGAIRQYEDTSGRQLPSPERWGAGTLEEVSETAGLRGQSLRDYYLRGTEDEGGRDARADRGRDGIGEEESGRPVREDSAPLTAEDGRGGSDLGRSGEERESSTAREPGSLRVGEAEELPFETEEKPQPSEGTRRILEEKRRTDKQIAQAKKKGPQQKTKFPDYKPVSEESGKSFKEIAGEIRSRAAAERARRLEHIPKEKFFGTESLQKLGVKIDGALGNYTGTKQLREIERAAKQLKTEIRRQEKILNATDKEKQMARGLAAGVYTMEDFGPNVRRGVVEALADYYEYERTINDDMVLQRRRDINAQLEDQIQTMLPDDPGYKIPPMFVLNHRTPERICRNIFGDEKGKEVYEKIFRPVSVNEAEKIRFVKKQFDDVREIEGSDGKKSELTRDEAMLAQQVLEGRAAAELVAGMELEDGRERIEAVAENILNGDEPGASAREFGLSDQERGIAEQYARWLQTKAIYDSGAFDTVKIDNAVKIYQEKYNLFYDAINDFLVAHGYKPIGFIRGYAPHMQMQEDINLFAGYLKNLGINDDVTRLPANIAGRTADLKPNKRWNPYFLHRTGDLTDFDIAKGFQSYVAHLADVLYHTDDTMRIRAMSRHYRALYAPDNIKENLDWAKYMNSTSPEVKREEMQKRGILSRDAAVSEEEVNDAFDKWIEEQFDSIQNTTKYSDYVMYLDNFANILAGKQSMSDRGGEYDWGRESLKKSNKLISAFARTQVAGNLSSAFSQLSQIPMITAELGPKYVAQAIRDYANGTLKKAAFAQQSDHLTERAGSGALVTDKFEMAMEKLFTPLRLVDGFTASLAVRAKYLQQVEAGKNHAEALKEADAYAKRVQGSRKLGSKPLAFHSKKAVNQALHLFQLELFNSWEHVSQDLPADFREIERTQGKKAAAGALAKVILSYLMAAFLLNRATEEAYGGTPAPFDLLGITTNFIASGYGLTTNAYLETIMDNVMQELFDKRIFQTEQDKMREEFKLTDAADGAWYEIGSDIPFLRNIMGLMGLGDQTLPIPLMGLGNELKYLVKDVRSDIENGHLSGQTGMDLLHIMNQLLPGGRQLTKTEEGIQLMQQGGRYINGKLYYPVENTFGNWVRAILFGRSALEESNAYYAGDDHALSVGATELYKMMTGKGSAENQEAYEALQTAKNLNDDQTEWLRNYAENGGDSWKAWQTMQQYKAADNSKTTGSLEKGKQTRTAITNAVLTDKERLELYRVMDKNNEGKADKLDTIMNTGLTWAEAVQVYDAYAEIEANENLSKKEQAEQWASWVNRQNYTDAQKDVIRDTIKFWGSYAIEDTTVDKMTIAGLDPDAADKVTAIINGLQPEDGRDKVTDLQKQKAIAASDLTEDEQWQAIIGLTPESYTSTLAKITVMQDMGISPDIWTKSKQAMYDADDAGNNNDSTDQKEAQAALDDMDIPNDQKAILWQLANKSWSWKKNPYDTDIGQEVYALMHDGDTGKSSTTKKKSGGRGGRGGGGRGGKKSSGGLELGAAFGSDSGHSGMFDSILLGWKRRKYSKSQILAFVNAGLLTQEEADEILATLQETEAEEGSLALGTAEG